MGTAPPPSPSCPLSCRSHPGSCGLAQRRPQAELARPERGSSLSACWLRHSPVFPGLLDTSQFLGLTSFLNSLSPILAFKWGKN